MLINHPAEIINDHNLEIADIEYIIMRLVNEINFYGVDYKALQELGSYCVKYFVKIGFTKLTRELMLRGNVPKPPVIPTNAKIFLEIYFQAKTLMHFPERATSRGQVAIKVLKKAFDRGGAVPMGGCYMGEIKKSLFDQNAVMESFVKRNYDGGTYHILDGFRKPGEEPGCKNFFPHTIVYRLGFDSRNRFLFYTERFANTFRLRGIPEAPKNNTPYIFVFRIYPVKSICCHIETDGLHHSDLSLGKSISSAGCIYFEDGNIITLTNASGHYTPSPESFYSVLNYLHESRIDLSRITCLFMEGSYSQIFTPSFFSEVVFFLKKFGVILVVIFLKIMH